jgi:hypothetical protein
LALLCFVQKYHQRCPLFLRDYGQSWLSDLQKPVVDMAPLLHALPLLVSLDLRFVPLFREVAGARAFSAVLPTLTALTQLSLRGTELGTDDSAAVVCPTLTTLTALRRLDLSFNTITPVDDEHALAPALATLSSLVDIDISHGVFISHDGLGLPHVLAALGTLTGLQSLRTSICGHARVCDALASTLRALPALTRLDLCGIFNYTPDPAPSIDAALEEMTALRHLDCHDVQFAGGQEGMCRVLRALTGLTYLGIGGMHLPTLKTTVIKTVLPALTRLTHLDISRTELPAESMQALADVLSATTTLRCVELTPPKLFNYSCNDCYTTVFPPALCALVKLKTQ